jgi:hypothetical protein
MFRLVIKLAVAALLVNAAVQVGSSYWRCYQYEDALQEIAQFGERRTERQLCSLAMAKADELGVPITAKAVGIRRGTNPTYNCETGFQAALPAADGTFAAKIYIDAKYNDRLRVFPGYSYPWDFTLNVSAFVRP